MNEGAQSDIQGIGPHDHVCHVFRNRSEQVAAAVPFLLTGLRRKQRCVFIAAPRVLGDMRNALGAAGVDVAGAEKNRRIELSAGPVTWHGSGAPGTDGIIDVLERATRPVRGVDAATVRVVVETVQSPGADCGGIAWDATLRRLQSFFQCTDCVSLFQYNLQEIASGYCARDLLSAHPFVFDNGVLHRNTYWIRPQRQDCDVAAGVNELLESIRAHNRIVSRERDTVLQLETIMDTVDDGVIVQDGRGIVLTWNRGVEALTGIPAQTAVGRKYEECDFACVQLSGGYFSSAQHPGAVTLRTGKPCRDIIMGITPPGIETRWVSVNSRPVFGCDGSQPEAVVVCMHEITPAATSSNRIVRMAHLERILHTLSMTVRISDNAAIDDAIERGLAAIGQFTGADRAYVFLYRNDGSVVDNTHEWCADGIQPQKDNLQGIRLDGTLPVFSEHARTGRVYVVQDVGALPDGPGGEKKLLQDQGIRSLMVVFIRIGAACIGFMGFDAVRNSRTWSECDQYVLRRTGTAIAQALERKRWAVALQESNTRLAMAVNNARVGLWDWDIPAGCFHINDWWAAIAGYGPDELGDITVSTWTGLCHPEDVDTSNQQLRQHFAGEIDCYDCELRLKHRDGHWNWVRDQGQVYERDRQGRPVRMAGTRTDIQAEKTAADALRQSEARMRFIFDSIPDCVMKVTPDLTVVWANQATLSRCPDVVGQSCTRAFCDSNEPCHDCPLARCLQTGVMVTVEKMSRRFGQKDRNTWWQSVGIPQKDDDGHVVGAIALWRDITELVRSEEADRQAQKMQSIGTLAGGIAHEFNNIMGGIMGYTEISLEGAIPGSEVHGNLEEILTLCGRARDIVKQLLTFSRKSAVRSEPLDLRAVIEQHLKMLRNIVPATIEIRTDISAKDCIVRADATQIQQVCMNLCLNAVHAMKDSGGVIVIELSPIELDEGAAGTFQNIAAGPYARITISDTGTGIDLAIIDQIFDPFFTTKEVGEGSGMGLAVAHSIVSAHKGTIHVSSTPGSGTTCCVLLPLTAAPVAPQPQIQSGDLPGGSEHILIVDDEPTLTVTLDRQLRNLGYAVTSTTSALEALALFRSRPDSFGLIITDLTMPELTGDRLAAEAVSIRPDIPIIVATGYGSAAETEHVKHCGTQLLLRKPFQKQELALSIRQLLDRNQPDSGRAKD